MKPLLSFVLGLTIIMSLLMGVFLLPGRAEPIPQRIARLHLTDCALPCWNGITLGSSSIGTVLGSIGRSFPKFVSHTGTLHSITWQYYDPTKDDTNINVTYDNGHILSIAIRSNFAAKVMPTLGDMLVVYGAPTCVVVNADSGYVTLDYDQDSDEVNLQFTVSRPAFSSPVRTLTIGISTPSVCSKASALSWLAYRHTQYIAS